MYILHIYIYIYVYIYTLSTLYIYIGIYIYSEHSVCRQSLMTTYIYNKKQATPLELQVCLSMYDLFYRRVLKG